MVDTALYIKGMVLSGTRIVCWPYAGEARASYSAESQYCLEYCLDHRLMAAFSRDNNSWNERP